jgi:hypothetical protein
MRLQATSRLFRIGAALLLGLAVLIAALGARPAERLTTAGPTAPTESSQTLTSPEALAATIEYQCTNNLEVLYQTLALCKLHCTGGGVCFQCMAPCHVPQP